MKGFLTWALILFAFSLALTFAKGFDVLSFYFCLAIAPVLSMACASTTISAIGVTRERGEGIWAACPILALRVGLLSAIPLSVILLNGLRKAPCDTLYGLLFYLFGPLFSSLFATIVAASLATLVPSVRKARLAFLVLFVGSFVFNLRDLYWEPAVFFYNPFLGLYPGAIYDQRIEVGRAYLFFRVFCLAVAGLFVTVATTFVDSNFRRRIPKKPVPYVLLSALAAAVAILFSYGGTAGFRVTRSDLRKALSEEATSDLCIVRYSKELDRDFVGAVLRDCDFRHLQAARFFGVEARPKVTLYLYRDEDQKAHLMGARDVEVAKPWLQEIHLAPFVPGDEILAHEVAHVVAGRLSQNALSMPLRYGFIPHMAEVEGLAVAFAFYDFGPSPHEWSLATIRAGIDLNPTRLWSPSLFVLEHPGRAYTALGSFVRFLLDTFGQRVIWALAQGFELEEATGLEPMELYGLWVRYLEEVAGKSVDEALVRRARSRLSGPNMLERRCPVDVSRGMAEAQEAMREGDWALAMEKLKALRSLSPADPWIRRAFLLAAARVGPQSYLRELVFSFVAEGGTPEDLICASDALTLEAVGRGLSPGPEAFALLERAKEIAEYGPSSRAAAVRMEVLKLPPEAIRAVLDVLNGVAPKPAERLLEALTYGEDSGVLHYLVGKALIGEARFSLATEHLLCALALGLGAGELETEAHAALGRAAYFASQREVAAEHLGIARLSLRYEGERGSVEDFLERLSAVE